MNKAFLSVAMLVIGGSLNIGCMNQASVDVKDGYYQGSARSTNPEALLDTVSRNKTRETYADAYYDSVQRGAYAYGRVGPVGQYGLYCPNGMCITQPPAPVTAPPPSAPQQPATPSKTPANKPVTREELEQVRQQAADAQKKANVSIGILKTVRTEKETQKDNAPTVAPPPPAPQTVAPPVTTPAQKPLSQQEIDEINKRAQESRQRAEAAAATPSK